MPKSTSRSGKITRTSKRKRNSSSGGISKRGSAVKRMNKPAGNKAAYHEQNVSRLINGLQTFSNDNISESYAQVDLCTTGETIHQFCGDMIKSLHVIVTSAKLANKDQISKLSNLLKELLKVFTFTLPGLHQYINKHLSDIQSLMVHSVTTGDNPIGPDPCELKKFRESNLKDSVVEINEANERITTQIRKITSSISRMEEVMAATTMHDMCKTHKKGKLHFMSTKDVEKWADENLTSGHIGISKDCLKGILCSGVQQTMSVDPNGQRGLSFSLRVVKGTNAQEPNERDANSNIASILACVNTLKRMTVRRDSLFSSLNRGGTPES